MKTASGFNLSTNPISGNPFGIKRIQYFIRNFTQNYTISLRNYTIQTSYLLIRPSTSWNGEVILYYHPTVFGKQFGPTSLGKEYQAISGLYAALGYIVIFPDYIGYGISWQNVHPYVIFPGPNIQNGAGCLNDAYNLIRDYSPNTAIPYKVHTMGYSEGASYALFNLFCQKRQNTTADNNVCLGYNKLNESQYNFTNSTGMDGAYSLDQVVMPFLRSRVGTDLNNNEYRILNTKTTDFGKPGLSAFALMSYTTYSRVPSNLSDWLLDSFYQMNCTDSAQDKCNVAKGSHLNVKDAFMAQDIDNSQLPMSLAYSAFKKAINKTSYVTQVDILAGSSLNNVEAFVNKTFLDDYEFNLACQQASLTKVNYSAMASDTFLFSLNSDSVVSPNNTVRLV